MNDLAEDQGPMDVCGVGAERVTPCFTPGTTITTPSGECLVEELVEGDRVVTRDNGPQTIRWIGVRHLSGRVLAENDHLKPVLIQKGALGHGLPHRDMKVSPNHRMLVAGDQTALYFQEREVLAAAKHLINHRGIHALHPTGATYIHFMFDAHQVVLSDGTWSESFQPSDYTLRGIGNAQRNEIFRLFPDLAVRSGRESYLSARRILSRREARQLAE